MGASDGGHFGNIPFHTLCELNALPMKSVEEKIVWVILSGAAVAAAGGLLIPGLYRDSPLYKTAWYANDAITLLLTGTVTLYFFQKDKGLFRSRLLRLGTSGYFFYNYAFYLFGAAFNAFFLLYALLVTLSLYALVLGLIQLHDEPPVLTLDLATRRLTTFFLIMIALPLAIVEVREWIIFVYTRREPAIPVLVLALDLTLVVPNTLLAAFMLWQRNAWGLSLSTVMLFKSSGYGAVLVAGAIAIGQSGTGPWDPLLPFYIFVCLGGSVFLFRLLKSIKPTRVL